MSLVLLYFGFIIIVLMADSDPVSWDLITIFSQCKCQGCLRSLSSSVDLVKIFIFLNLVSCFPKIFSYL